MNVPPTFIFLVYSPVNNFGTVIGENPDWLLLSGTVVGENPDHVCWEYKILEFNSPNILSLGFQTYGRVFIVCAGCKEICQTV